MSPLRILGPAAAALLMSTPLLWQVANPIPYRSALTAIARSTGLSPYLLAAVVRVESRGDASARSDEGAVGLMQVRPGTAAWVAPRAGLKVPGAAGLVRPSVNLRIGAWYLAYLYRQYDGDPALALAAYNAGPGTVGKWLKAGQWSGRMTDLARIPYPETRAFLRLVTAGERAYRVLYAGSRRGS